MAGDGSEDLAGDGVGDRKRPLAISVPIRSAADDVLARDLFRVGQRTGMKREMSGS